MIETDGVDGKALSLDDYIKQRKMGDQFSLSNQRKRVANLSEKALNKDLDSMIAYRVMNLHEPIKSSSCNKFNRGSLKDDSGDESDDDTPQVRMATIDSDDDVVMGDAEKSNLHEDLRDLPRFETVETIQGLRVRSQQWRMLPENLMDRPEGVPRLEVLPLPENERYRFKHNKIQKKNKLSRLSSVSSSNSKASKINVTSGTFVEKGGFTYKIGNRNRNGSQEGIIGIERSKRAPDLLPPQPPAAASAPSININLNYNSVPHLQNENNVELDNHAGPSAHVIDSTTAIAEKLIAAILAMNKPGKQEPVPKYNIDVQKQIGKIQNRPLIVEDRGQRQDLIGASAGDGIADFAATTHSTNLPFNIRFA